MTNECIFYIVGLALGTIFGFAMRELIAKGQTVNITIKTNENKEVDDERAD